VIGRTDAVVRPGSEFRRQQRLQKQAVERGEIAVDYEQEEAGPVVEVIHGPVAEGEDVIGVFELARRHPLSSEFQAELDRLLDALDRSDVDRHELLRELVRADEYERERTAADIHGSTLQMLGLISLKLHVLRGELPEGTAVEEITALDDAVATATTSLRQVIGQLRPLALEEGLQAALGACVHELSDRIAIPVLLDYRVQDEPDPDVRVIVFRVVQEALHNVASHADARQVLLTVSNEADGVRVAVADDGAGFEVPPSEGWVEHRGLSAMRQRVEAAGGDLDVASSAGVGTTVRFWMPLALRRAPAEPEVSR
jgi:signal transduction histidine kinase